MSKIKVNPILKVIFILLIAYIVLNFFSQQQLIEKKQHELATVQNQINEEEKLSKSLEREKEMLDSDESLEKIAREKLGMVKPGERVFFDINRQ